MSIPLNQIVYKKEDFEDPSLTLLNQDLSNIKASLNGLLGHAGPIKLGNHLDLQGNRLVNLGEAQSETDAVSKLSGTQLFGPEVMQTQLDALGNKILQTTRHLNDTTQREMHSTFLNGVLNTAPTANSSQVFFGVPSGGTVSLTVTAGTHQRVDGTQVPYAAFTDTVALPTSFALTSLTRSGGVVTAVTTAANPLVAGETITIPVGSGLSDASFAGTFLITTIISTTSFKYTQIAPDAAATGGIVSLGSVYYYFIQHGTNVLARSGPFADDSQTNRTNANFDGQTVVAVVVVNASGGDATNSAAGATPPATNNGAGVHLLTRL